jgi:hypothetical protein
VIPSVILTVKVLYGYLSLNPLVIPLVKSSWKNTWKCHVTVRLPRFKFVGHSVGKIVLQKSTSPHRCNFLNKLYRPSAIRSVYTDRVGDGIISVSNSVSFCRFSGNETIIYLNYILKVFN